MIDELLPVLMGERDRDLKLEAAVVYAAQFADYPEWVRKEVHDAFLAGCMTSWAIDRASNLELLEAIEANEGVE